MKTRRLHICQTRHEGDVTERVLVYIVHVVEVKDAKEYIGHRHRCYKTASKTQMNSNAKTEKKSGHDKVHEHKQANRCN